jgi:hypothetical protein
MTLVFGIVGTLVVVFLYRILCLFLTRFSRHSFYDVLPFLHANDPGYLEELFNSGREASIAGTPWRKAIPGSADKAH